MYHKNTFICKFSEQAFNMSNGIEYAVITIIRQIGED